MARFHSFSVMVALFLASLAVMVIPGLASKEYIVPTYETLEESLEFEVPTLVPYKTLGESLEFEAPEPASAVLGHYIFDGCLDKLTPECGEEIFTAIFENGPYDADCCRKLVLMGKICHNTMLMDLLLLPEFKPKASQALLKSEQVWNACVSIAAALPPTPSSSS